MTNRHRLIKNKKSEENLKAITEKVMAETMELHKKVEDVVMKAIKEQDEQIEKMLHPTIPKMDDFEKSMWKAALILWEALAIRPDEILRVPTDDFKNGILMKLGLIDHYIANGCPFCEVDWECTDCVIYYCQKDTPYYKWSQIYTPDYTMDLSGNKPLRHYHSQKAAEAFYKWLINKAKEIGYEPDYPLKFW